LGAAPSLGIYVIGARRQITAVPDGKLARSALDITNASNKYRHAKQYDAFSAAPCGAVGGCIRPEATMASARTRFYAKKLFELTGFLPIGGFLVEHLYSNFQAVGPGGAERFDTVVKDLQTNPIIIFAEIGMIGLPLLYHALYGIFVASMARPNNGGYGYLRNWTYLLQRITGVILLFYIGYHVWNTRMVPVVHPDAEFLQHVDGQPLVSSAYMHHYFTETHFGIQVLWFYVLGIACAVYHFANGLWNAAIHWGLTISPRSQRISGVVCGLVGVTLLAVGLASLLAFYQMQV
jgi:succinate dehydrogenase / fumarate reductase cytochrome b subunit